MNTSILSEKRSPQRVTVQATRGGIELIDRIAEQWRELCAEGPSNQPFYRPEWIAAYMRAFAPRDRLLLITAKDMQGGLQGVLPLLEQRVLYYPIPVTKLRGAAGVHSCRFDLVRGPGPEGSAAVLAIWHFLKHLEGWDLLELPNVPEDGSAQQLLSAAQKDGFLTARLESMRSPYIVLEGLDPKQDTLLIGRNAHFRQNLRRLTRNVTTTRSLRLRRTDSADLNTLQSFYDLEGSGWKGKKGTAIVSSEETRQFYSDIARAAERFGYLSLYFLEFDGLVAAGHFGLTYADRYYSVKVAYDENQRTFGPGQLLVKAILRDVLDRGVSEFDFLGPWMDWKANWTEQGRSHFLCYIFGRGILGRTLYRATQQKFKMATALKRAARSPALSGLRSYLAQKHSSLLSGRR